MKIAHLEKLVFSNLIIRIILSFYVTFKGTWQAGDSLYYLEQASKVIHGSWGGDGFRGVFYSWYLLILAPHAFFSFTPDQIFTNSPIDLLLPLLVQTLLVWGSGYWLFKKGHKALGLIVLFDPVLFIYSHKLMSDALFGVFCFWFAVTLWKWISSSQKEIKLPIFCALILACASMTRSVGSILIVFTVLFVLFEWLLKRKISKIQLFYFVTSLVLFLAPILYWNKMSSNRWGTTTQGLDWLASVAGVVEYHAEGVGFQQAPMKWFSAHPVYNLGIVTGSLFSHFGTFFVLTLKGILRVLIGHVNVEFYSLFTGTTVEGPGWFKPREVFNGYYIQGKDIFIWVFGIILNLLACFFVYKTIFKKVLKTLKLKLKKANLEKSSLLFFLGCGFLQAVLPLVYGDARFRISLVLFWVVAAFISEERLQKASRHKPNLHRQDL